MLVMIFLAYLTIFDNFYWGHLLFGQILKVDKEKSAMFLPDNDIV